VIGLWKSRGIRSDFTVNGVDYPLVLHRTLPADQCQVLLFNLLTTADCEPFVNRASEIRETWDHAQFPRETFYKRLAEPLGELLAAEVAKALSN